VELPGKVEWHIIVMLVTVGVVELPGKVE
jgi:hypothetical protein